MHSKEKGNRTKEQKDRQCVLVAGEGVVSPARTHVSAAIWPYAGAGNNNFRGVLRSRSPETRGHRTIVPSCLHFGSRDVAAVAGCGSKYLQR